jgi:hypothetical protein
MEALPDRLFEPPTHLGQLRFHRFRQPFGHDPGSEYLVQYS